jgi:hypothetical protein
MNPLVWIGIGVAVLLGGTAIAIATLSSHPHSNAASGHDANKIVHPAKRTTSTTATTSSTTTSTQALAAQQAAELSGLLTQSASDRSAIVSAVAAIANCGDLEGAEMTLNDSATSRQSLLNQLQGLTLNALPNNNELTEYLITAWNNSLASDQSYSDWAGDEINDGCTVNDNSDSNYQAAQVTDAQSTSNKSSFAAVWNPIATSYGLPTVTTASF